MRGLFVTATDTGVGKTVLSAALVAAMSAAGERVRAHKPAVTGLERQAETGPADRATGKLGAWPPDHELLASVAGMTPEQVAPLRYEPPVSPHLAAALAGERIDPASLLARARGKTEETSAADEASVLTVVEGIGGLLVPLTDDYTVRDLAAELGLPVVIAARPGLGTINHTLLTLQAARAADLDVRAIVLTPWSDDSTAIEDSNRDTIARLGEIEVAALRHVPSPSVADLARAGAALPWRRWCSPH